MSLNTAGDAEAINTEYQKLLLAGGGLGNDRAFLDTLQSILDIGFQKATPTIGDVDISPPAGTLFIPLGTPYEMPMNIGQACADYWVKAIGFGEPEEDHIDNIINDAAKIAAPIVSKIMHLSNSGTPYYFKFVDVIHTEVKTIIWTVTEKDDGDNDVIYNPNVL